ncbi:unnamed protein product [Toxocara canis]|uniref:Reverse transcriptase domain-containing protein n=1 Tax=Toxocara canis TaxID=6265 RepID=A0A183UD58_TOXCA|nr:unnamed protein product [Toxocara canis]
MTSNAVDQDYAGLTKKSNALEHAPSRRSTRLQSHTKHLMAVTARMIVEGRAEGDEYKMLCKEISRSLQADCEAYRLEKLRRAMESHKSLKKAEREASLKPKVPTAVEDCSGRRTVVRAEMKEICENFYNDLYSSKVHVPEIQLRAEEEEIPAVMLDEIKNALSKIKPDRSPGSDKIKTKSGYCTNDHIHVLSQLLEKCKEYQILLSLAFVDHRKAFDSAETTAVLNALHEAGVNPRYVELKDKFKGGINIDGEGLSHLLFADDCVLLATNPKDLQSDLQQLSTISKTIGLEMNTGKTKWMRNSFCTEGIVCLDDVELELVKYYVYLGRQMESNSCPDGEWDRRRRTGWIDFGRYKPVLRDRTLPMKLRASIFNTTVLPAMLYACETRATTKFAYEKNSPSRKGQWKGKCAVSPGRTE